ncbi:hypothetical protein [Nodularia sphaerocarpa]|uniref:hypothetical protein n=1 Tax=Nodularia sphaerocarpa TaxID=137816 RepID=UPI001EFABA2C|nr:hypothetical protein [Nodularia sphaerocarpa]MDB9373111.1 hypothetical protein [Nodularia sphaerocarpa CS-585]MDB9379828.1 hypothetical protein [Nodularia sphaerocarpa CS-585A2]ULP73241.1 hypothetical protein BDGGKGIB_02894 [Nodularia sphaerocarpa UHCC 0038]
MIFTETLYKISDRTKVMKNLSVLSATVFAVTSGLVLGTMKPCGDVAGKVSTLWSN